MRHAYAIFWYLLSRLSVAISALLLLPLALSQQDVLTGAVARVTGASGTWMTGKAVAVSGTSAGLYIYGVPLLAALVTGAMFRHLGREHKRPLTLVEGALFAVLAWPYLAWIGAMPFALSGRLSPLDAFFESMSSFTATGLSNFDYVAGALPPSLVLWHGLMNWLGGLAFVVMLVTVLPQVSGCFGITLTARQSVYFSPVWRKMHQSIWQGLAVYGGLTVIFIGVFLALGLTPLRALLLALTTISTTGSGAASAFSMGAAGQSPALEAAGCCMMLVTGGNFLLYWKCIARRSPRLLWADAELRAALAMAAACSLLVALHLTLTGTYPLLTALRHGAFHVISFFTTAGFSSVDASAWPDFDRYVLFLLAFLGGCIGSPAGGLKVVRLLVLAKLTAQELRRTLHPHMVVSVRLDGLAVPDKVVGRMLAFFFLAAAFFFFGTIAIAASGVAILPAMGLSAGCLTSTGQVALLFGLESTAALAPATKAVAILLMIAGRAGIFSFLMLGAIGGESVRKKW